MRKLKLVFLTAIIVLLFGFSSFAAITTTPKGVQKLDSADIVDALNNNADILDDHIDKIANSDILGHVKLSDEYKTSAGSAEDGIGASSKAVSDVYNEINNKLAWNVVTTGYGSAPIDVNLNDYNELHILVIGQTDNVLRCATFNITRADINEMDRVFYDGAMFSPTSYFGASISVSTSKVSILNFAVNGTNCLDAKTQIVVRAR